MIALWAYADSEATERLDRAIAPQFDPPSGTERAGGSFAIVTMTSPGFHIRYRTSLSGYPAPPENIDAGQGGMSPQTFVATAEATTYAVAVAFDPSGSIPASVPVQGWWRRI